MAPVNGATGTGLYLESIGGITVMLRDNPSTDVMWAKGAVVPTDGDAGYAKGCIFIHTDGGEDTTLYVNEGTAASADFNAK